MAISLSAVAVRHERRIRLVFTNTLAGGAFATPGLYVVTPNQGSAPVVLEAYVVQNSPNVVELAFDRDLSQWATYSIAALSVPATDGSFTDASPDDTNTAPFALSFTVTPPDVENPDADLQAYVYGEDLVYDGTDFIETDAGDLATIAGFANLQGALNRRVVQTTPLSWDPTYGGQNADRVNGPSPLGATVAGDAQRQAMSDDRVKTATVSFAVDPTNPANTLVQLLVVPIGAADGSQPIAVPLVTV